MNGLDKLERVARNLPVKGITMGRAETLYGPVYMAWGKNKDYWHGVWGADIEGGSAQVLQIKPNVSEKDVQQILLDTANLALEVYRGRNPITA